MNEISIIIYRYHITSDCIVFSSCFDDFGKVTYERCLNLANFLFPSSAETSSIFSYVLFSMLKSSYNMFLNVDRFSHHTSLEHRFVSNQGDIFILHVNHKF